MQHTICQTISAAGIGLHTGRTVHICLKPADVGCGVVFQRTDLPRAAPIPALYSHTIDTKLSTVLGEKNNSENRIATIEHLMAALYGCGIDNILVLIDGPEIPIFDGSSSHFVSLLEDAGRQQQNAYRKVIKILKPVCVKQGDFFAKLLPNPTFGLSLSMTIDFAARAIGQQTYHINLTPDTFKTELSFNRTFALLEEIDTLRQMGLARGGSFENAIIVDDNRILNSHGLRDPNEFVRHKMLDAIGDLYLAGNFLQARFYGHCSGHTLNNRLLQKLFSCTTAWKNDI
ncbi:MAG: UDP-3-O-[Acetobacter sp.]|nr:UDP-3-O-[3-hydroxymyristoyl] N-acetylglucosamine deacetylase [Acetobacter sp.]